MSRIRICAACKNLGEGLDAALGKYLAEKMPQGEFIENRGGASGIGQAMFGWALAWDDAAVEQMAAALWAAYEHFLAQRKEQRAHQGILVEVSDARIKNLFSIGDDVRDLAALETHLTELFRAMQGGSVTLEQMARIKGCVVRK